MLLLSRRLDPVFGTGESRVSCLHRHSLICPQNEPLGNNFVRDPFWNAMSERAFVHMDSKRFHRELHDFTTMADVI